MHRAQHLTAQAVEFIEEPLFCWEGWGGAPFERSEKQAPPHSRGIWQSWQFCVEEVASADLADAVGDLCTQHLLAKVNAAGGSAAP